MEAWTGGLFFVLRLAVFGVGVGSLCLFFYDLGISMFRPCTVLNQRQVSLVVSD